MYAIIQTGGKQYQVAPGDTIYAEKLNANEGDEIVINEVLAVSTDDGFKTGKPFVEGATVTLKLEKNGKQKKITVFTYKPKKNEKRKKGHRQPYSKLSVVSINA